MRMMTILVIVVTLSACTAVPEQIQGEFASITPVRVEPGVYGSDVRWGGVIMDTRHSDNQTCRIRQRPRSHHHRPDPEYRSA